MEKRGIGHIEVILSFILFISATSLALYFFMPAYKTEIISSSLSYTYDSVLKGANTELYTYYVQPDNCESKSSVSVKIDELGGKSVRVENKNGNFIGSKSSGGKVCIAECSSIPMIYSVYLSEGFTKIDSACTGSSADGNIVSSLLEKVVSENEVIAMANDYETDYDALKVKLKIPERTDFAFSLIFSTTERVDAQREAPSGIDVYSQVTRLKVLRTDGKRQFAEFQVKVW